MVFFNTRRHTNEVVYYNIGFLEDAIQKKLNASFYDRVALSTV